jgi:hypothetical protein
MANMHKGLERFLLAFKPNVSVRNQRDSDCPALHTETA